jgi:hypothetical protein
MTSAILNDDVTREELAMVKYTANLGDPGFKHKPTTFYGFHKLPQELHNSVWAIIVRNLATYIRNKTRIIAGMRGEPLSSPFVSQLRTKRRQYCKFLRELGWKGSRSSRAPMNLELAAKSVATILTSVEIFSFILTLRI